MNAAELSMISKGDTIDNLPRFPIQIDDSWNFNIESRQMPCKYKTMSDYKTVPRNTEHPSVTPNKQLRFSNSDSVSPLVTPIPVALLKEKIS